MGVLLFTGFPGFLGSALLPRVLARAPGDSAVCLVQARFTALAARRLEELIATTPSVAGRVRLVEGDITRPGLGLSDPSELVPEVTEVWHLAAAYDLGLSKETGLAVNVEGTRNVADLAARCTGLRRLHHVSTCYVSGRHHGLFTEDDLVRGQAFNNAYEESKYLAEVEVQARMGEGLPATVYRPAVVVGDSRTGATQKYDGPYPFIRWLLRQPRVAVMPMVGDPHATEVNVVPRDVVVDAIAHLSGRESSVGRVYQLADPAPLTVAGMLDVLARATGQRIIRPRVPLRLAQGSVNHIPGVGRLLGIPAPALDYLVHPTRYATDHTRADLAGSGIRFPPFASYVDVLVSFVRRHPEVAAAPA